MGQKFEVRVTRFNVDESIEQKILSTECIKREQVSSLQSEQRVAETLMKLNDWGEAYMIRQVC